MNGEVTVKVSTGVNIEVEYTYTFPTCPQTADIVCEANKIEVIVGTLTPTPTSPIDVWTQLANEGGTITLYDAYDEEAGTLVINGFNGTGIIYFDTNYNCSGIASDACYFKFTINQGGKITTYLDLYPSEVISQNWEFTEISTFTARAPFSREFRVPLTEINAQIFNAVQLPNYSGVDFYNKKVDATIYVDDIPVITGFIRLIRSIVQAGVRTDLELSFYGNAPSLFSAIGQKKLKDITALPGLNTTVTRAKINTPPTSYVTYAMIDRGNNNNLTVDKLTTNLPYVTDFTPCVSWGWILENIITDAGYELEAVDVIAELNNVWMPWINTTPFVLSQAVGGALIIKQSSGTVPLTNSNTRFSTPSNGFIAPIDPLGWWDPNPTIFTNAGWGPNGIIGLITPGTYETSAWATFDYPYNTATTITISLVLVPYTTSLPVQEFIVTTINIAANTPGTYFIGGNLTINLPNATAINGGQKFNMSLKSSAGFGGASTVNIYAGDPDQAFIGTGFSINQRIGSYLNSWVYDFPSNAPDATQAQFLQDVLNMFNCAIIQDKLIDTKIKIAPMVNYLGSGITDDWSNYLAYDKDIVIKSTAEFLNNKLTFTYSAGGDSNSKFFVDNAQRIYGNYEVTGYTANPTDEPNEFAQGTREIKLTTQSTPCSNFPGTSIVLPRFIDNATPATYVAPGMRALYVAGQYTINWNGLNPGSVVVRLLNHYSTLPADAVDYDLNWAPEAPLHYILSNPVNNLFNRYWRNYLNELYSPQGRVMEAYFNLSLGDILNFDFSNKYFINDSYWRVLKISDYKIGSGELTKVVLIKILNLELGGCNLTVDRSLPDGSYTWTLDGNPVTGTLACCNNIGGYWDSVNDKCYGRYNSASSNNNVVIPPPIVSNGTLPTNSVTKTENYSGGEDTIYQVAVGKNITDLGSDYSLLVGRDLQTDITPDSIITGRNTLVKNTGLHFGGGYRAGVGNSGTMQTGTIVLSNQTIVPSYGYTIGLSVGNDANTNIILPDDTQWMITIDLAASDLSGVWTYSKYVTTVYNAAGVHYLPSALNLIIQDGAMGLTIAPVIDVTTNPAEVAILAQFTAGGLYVWPTPSLTITATVNYTQIR